MRTIVMALLSITVVAGLAGTADAASKRGKKSSSFAERQSDPRTFDDSLYYERLSEKIPFGSGAWWRQRQQEFARGG